MYLFFFLILITIYYKYCQQLLAFMINMKINKDYKNSFKNKNSKNTHMYIYIYNNKYIY